MPDVCGPQYLPCNPNHHAPCPPCASPAIYIALVAAPVALIFWFLRNLQHRALLEQLPDAVPEQIPAIPEGLETAAVSTVTPPQDETAHHSDGSSSSSGSADEKDRSGDVAGIRNKMLNAFGGILLDIRRSDESTIHPANGVLIQSMEVFCGNTDRVRPIFGTRDFNIETYSVMLDCWISKLEEAAESVCPGEKGRRYIFLLNNTYDVQQMMCCRGEPFSNLKLTSRLTSMIQRYKKSYFDECWVPLSNPCRLDKFTSDFLMISKHQMTWKVTAELRYKLRQEIVDLIVPPYEVSLLAVETDRSRLPEMVNWLKRAVMGKKKQKKYTVDALQKVIRELFEAGPGLMDEHLGMAE